MSPFERAKARLAAEERERKDRLREKYLERNETAEVHTPRSKKAAAAFALLAALAGMEK